MYAVLETGSKQYRVQPGDTLEVERLPAEKGATIALDRVLMVRTDGKVSIGTPTVTGASVLAEVLEHFRDEKKIIFKMRRREGYHKKQGHRQELTRIRIKEIRLPEATANA